MDISFHTSQIDPKIVVSAYKLYKECRYAEAIPVLQELLDMEPKNWQARLFFAVCLFKTGQPAAAHRSLRFTYNNCPDRELQQKACFALQFVTQELNKKSSQMPLEFGSAIDKDRTATEAEDLEAIIS